MRAKLVGGWANRESGPSERIPSENEKLKAENERLRSALDEAIRWFEGASDPMGEPQIKHIGSMATYLRYIAARESAEEGER